VLARQALSLAGSWSSQAMLLDLKISDPRSINMKGLVGHLNTQYEGFVLFCCWFVIVAFGAGD
jgi:hypothetical protein